MIDHEDGHRAIFLFQFKPELLVDGFEKSEGAVGVGRCRGCAAGRWGCVSTAFSTPASVVEHAGRAKTQGKVVGAVEPCGIQNGAMNITRRNVLKLERKL